MLSLFLSTVSQANMILFVCHPLIPGPSDFSFIFLKTSLSLLEGDVLTHDRKSLSRRKMKQLTVLYCRGAGMIISPSFLRDIIAIPQTRRGILVSSSGGVEYLRFYKEGKREKDSYNRIYFWM